MPQLRFARSTIIDVISILSFSILSMMLLVANPGYYSHDELQKLDHVSRLGLADYLSHYVVLARPESFGVPVRPFSFLIQGVLALFMQDYPVFVHLFDVLTHALVATLLYALVLRYTQHRPAALLSALVFAVNPMTIIATGWSAALMDRWYILFGLAAFLYADTYVRRMTDRRGGWSLLAVFLLGTLAVLSKETALVLPASMLLMLVRFPNLNVKRWIVATTVWALPVVLFFLYRLSSLLTSFKNPELGAYQASVANVPWNLYVYFAYPFVVTITEANNWIFLSNPALIIAIVLHVTVVAFISFRWGILSGAVYLALYFMFLFPVLFIPIKGAHYLYGSSLVLSVAIAYLLMEFGKLRRWWQLCLGALLIIALALHTIILEGFVYSIGSCMNSALIGMQSAYLSHKGTFSVDLRAEPGAPSHILYRLATGRNQIGTDYPVTLSVSDWEDARKSDRLTLGMNRECMVYALETD